MSTIRSRVYPLPERVWHGLQALSVLLLVATGLEVHGTLSVLGMETAVRLHETAGFVLLAVAFLGLFYFVTSGAIRQYVSRRGELRAEGPLQVRWYLRGIFRGEPHPGHRTPERRMNPVQRATYVAILNVLLPWQLLTGFAMWGLDRWPEVERAVGGLAVLAPLHAAGSWLFVAFLIGHVYLTTTSGRRPLAAMRAMVTGVEEVEPVASPAEVLR